MGPGDVVLIDVDAEAGELVFAKPENAPMMPPHMPEMSGNGNGESTFPTDAFRDD
ncbi:MAG: hypothetical protein AAFN11_17520 [Chloroflexota bacterium]